MVKTGLREKVLAFVRSEGLLRAGDKVIVGVSGGKDSVALLHLLFELRHELGISLFIAHYHHGLRKTADHDQKFVRTLAAKLGLPFVTEKNRALPPRSASVEIFARDRRYAFFKKALQTKNADCVAVAHTRDDLAETVLMRILRGTGLAGLRSILPRRELKGVTVVRPLLAVTRREVERYVRDEHLDSVQDPTNRSLNHLRNRIRIRILPYLEKEIGRDIQANLAGLALIAGADYDLIERAAENAFKANFKRSAGRVSVSLKIFPSLHSALRRALIRAALLEINGDLNSFRQNHITSIETMILAGQTGSGLDLPKGIRGKIAAASLVFSKKSDI